jgi:hypothetical protein
VCGGARRSLDRGQRGGDRRAVATARIRSARSGAARRRVGGRERGGMRSGGGGAAAAAPGGGIKKKEIK